jgi:hypothetical protein
MNDCALCPYMANARQAVNELIDRIDKLQAENEKLKEENKRLADDFNYSHEKKKEVQAELGKHRWIPVSERLPEACLKGLSVYLEIAGVNEFGDRDFDKAQYDIRKRKWISSFQEVTHFRSIILPKEK